MGRTTKQPGLSSFHLISLEPTLIESDYIRHTVRHVLIRSHFSVPK